MSRDVGNIDFELQAKIADKFKCFALLQSIVHISATSYPFEKGFNQIVAF